jgi:hypothetical protein
LKRNAAVVAELKFGQTAVQAPLHTILMHVLHAALEHAAPPAASAISRFGFLN